MMSERTLADRIGVSTLWMPCNGETLWQALDEAFDAGFKSIEIVPTTIEGNTGYPRICTAVGIDLDDLTAASVDRLGTSIARFPLRIVHGPHRDLNIASRNRGILAESVRQYLQVAQLAADIGASAVTFHPGSPDPNELGGDDEYCVARDIEFGREAAAFAERHGLKVAYENLGGFPTPERMVEILDGIGSERFGWHFDVGHAWLVPPRDPMAWLARLSDRVVSVHMHGTYYRADRGFENHQSLALDECTDLPGIMRCLNEAEYDGPINFEISARDISRYFDYCRQSRDILLAVAV